MNRPQKSIISLMTLVLTLALAPVFMPTAILSAIAADTIISFPPLATDEDRQRLVRLFITLDRSIRRLGEGNFPEAMRQSNTLLAHNPPADLQEAALTVQSLSAFGMHKWSDAISAFTKLERIHALKPELYFYLARCYSATKRYNLAIETYSKFLNAFGKRYNIRTVSPIQALNQSKAAIIAASNTASEDQKNTLMMAAAYKRRGALYEVQNNYKEAISNYVFAWSMETGKIEPQPVRLTQMERDQYRAQVQSVTDELKVEKSNAALYFAQGQAHFALGEWPQAISNYERAASMDPNNEYVFRFYEGIAYRMKGDNKTACGLLRKVFVIDPMVDETQTYSSPLIVPTHFFEMLRGQSALRASIKAGRADVDEYYDLGITELGLGRWKEAVSNFQSYISKGGRGTSLENAYFFSNVSYRMLKQKAQATTALINLIKKVGSGDLGEQIVQFYNGKLSSTKLLAQGKNETKLSRIKLMIGLDALAKSNVGEALSNLEWVAAHDEATDDAFIANELLTNLNETLFR